MMVNIGVDVGGTKLLAAALSEAGEILVSSQLPTPKHDYDATLAAIALLVTDIEKELTLTANVGIGMPGSITPKSGLVQNANSTWLNGHDLKTDISTKLGRGVRLANDANCFALSESVDGAGEGFSAVFGVILGTGVGGGLVVNNQILNGPRSIGGEWGHCCLPFMEPNEMENASLCWCGQKGCIESWISGPALLLHHNKTFDDDCQSTEQVVLKAQQGDEGAIKSLSAHSHRTARALSMVVNIFDPDVIVLGGGLSELDHLYEALPSMMAPYIFADDKSVLIRRPLFGAASGVRGAARLHSFDAAH